MVSVLLLMACLVADSARAAEDLWTQTGPASQDVRAMAVFSNTQLYFYAGTSARGVFLSSDGLHWAALNAGLTNLSITSIVGGNLVPCGATCPIPPTVWVGTDGGGVFRSIGGDWTPVNNGLSSLSVSALAFGRGVLYVATPTGLFKSIDFGASWTAVGDGLPSAGVVVVAVDPHDPANVYAGTIWTGTSEPVGGGVFRSTDGGTTWTAASNGLPVGGVNLTGGVRALTIDPRSPSTMYASLLNTHWCPAPCAAPPANSANVYKTTNAGGHWTTSDVGLWIPVTSLLVDPFLPTTVYAAGYAGGGFGGVFRSVDGGASWAGVNAGLGNLDVRALAFDPQNSSILYAGTAGSGVFWNHFSPSGGLCSTGQALCLVDGRFQAHVAWRSGSLSGTAEAVAITRSSGAFWFFDPTNLELVVKVLDGRSANGKWWVFYGALSNVEYTIKVTDTVTGAVKTYFNPQGQLASFADTGAF